MRARGGVALLAALALLVAISIVALRLAADAKPRRLRAAVVVQRSVLEAAATAGVEHARACLFDTRSSGLRASDRGRVAAMDAWDAADGLVIGPVSLGPATYRVELRDAGAQLNLNAATEDQLRRLLLALQLDARRADRVAQAIADWRDADRSRRANGAEETDYLRAGRPVLPTDGPFANVAELRLVLGMSDSLFEVMRPYVGTFGSGRINLNAAARPVLMTVPGMSEESVSLMLQYRARGRRIVDLDRFGDELSPTARARLREAMPILRQSTVLETREMHVASEAWKSGDSARVRVDAVLSREEEARVIWRGVLP